MHGLIKKGIDVYHNYKSFKTEHQLVIIESDDWGSLRTKDKKTRDKLNLISKAVKNDRYVQLDSIANAEDLAALFEVLNSVKDTKGNPACLTANVCTANPDFEAIKAVNFEEFHYKPFTETLNDYSQGENLFGLWQNGEQEKLFMPQLHGREHLHALAWLAELKAGNKELLKAFDLETWGIFYTALLKQRRKNLQAALYDYGMEVEADYHKHWIKDSAHIFKETFGYVSKSFIPPAYTWHSKIQSTLAEANIKSIQGIKLQYEPRHQKKTNYNRKPHYIGERYKSSGIIYAPRNGFFEPYLAPHKDWVNSTLKEIQTAFEKKKPAIIGSHRINFVGRLDQNHRDKNLAMLREVLQQLIKKYPDVEFIDSGRLADIIS
jgi:glycosyltransferase involved in cell wall biosynthesis